MFDFSLISGWKAISQKKRAVGRKTKLANCSASCQRAWKSSRLPSRQILGVQKGEKKGILLMNSMTSPGRREPRSLQIGSGTPVCSFGLCVLNGILVVSKREHISYSLRKATPKGEAEHTPQKKKKEYTAPQYYWNISFVCLSFGSN